MGIAGCVSVCVQGINKNNEGKQRKKHKWKHAEFDHVKKKAEKKHRSRILQAYENKTSYTLEDGHVGRNI
jgi:hypothetical protein